MLRTVSVVTMTTILAAGFVAGREARAQAKGAATSTEDVCLLLSKQDAATALGEALNNAKTLNGFPAGPGGTVAGCEYTSSGGKLLVTLRHLPQDGAAIYKQLCAQKNKDGLTGLGDVACWYNEKHQELQFMKGTTFFSLELKRNGDPTEAIKTAARKVFAQVK